MKTPQILLDYNSTRDELRGLAEQVADSFREIGLDAAEDSARAVVEKMRSDTLKVLFLGDFKQGKSTLINAMLGQRVLPAFSIPCTAVINEVKYGDVPSAKVHYRKIGNEAKRPIRGHKTASTDEPSEITIPVEQIEDFVVIKEFGVEDSDSQTKTIEYVEIFWPLELCKQGIEIIDSPGLNEHETRTAITRHYLNKVDAVVFVMSCLQLGSKTEMDFINQVLREEGHRDIVFVCNRIDQVKPAERDRIIGFGHNRLAGLTDLGPDGLFFVSGELALEGKLAGNKEQVDSSGFPIFETKLSNFLVRSRGKLKLLQSTRQILMEINRCLGEAIPSRVAILKESVATIEKRYEEMKPTLERAKAKWEMCEHFIDSINQDIVREIQIQLKKRLVSIASEIPSWIDQLQFEEKFELFNLQELTPTQCKRIQDEARTLLSDKLEHEFSKAIREVVPDTIQDGWEEINRKIGVNLRDLEVNLAIARTVMYGEQTSASMIPLPNAIERVLAGSCGLILGGFGSAYVGGTFGATEMVKSVVPSLLVGVGAIAIGITSPWILIPALFTAGVIQSYKHSQKLVIDLRKRTAEELQKTAELRCTEVVEQVSADVERKCGAVLADLKRVMQREVEAIEDSVEDVLKQKKLGEENCLARSSLLESQAQKLDAVRMRLNEIVLKIAEEVK
jgi:GTPase SAR1 family protein